MQCDVGALPFEEGSFDVVLCMNGLHVFPNKAKASASANTLTIKGSATEEAIRTAVEGIGYTFKGKA